MNDTPLTSLVTILLYLMVYNIVLLNIFFLVLPLHPSSDSLEEILLSHRLLPWNLIVTITLFSLAGVPPFAGFFMKISLITLLLNEFFFGWFLIIIPILLFSIFFYLSNLRALLSLSPLSHSAYLQTYNYNTAIILTLLTVFSVLFFDELIVIVYWICL